MAQEPFYATGKRKTAVARVWIKPGNGQISVNKQTPDDYFGGIFFAPRLAKPFAVTETVNKYDVLVTVAGGGKSAQIDAIVHGISRALQDMNTEMRLPLKRAGLLTRDSRAKERGEGARRLCGIRLLRNI